MIKTSYVLVVPGRIGIRYPSIEEATDAAKENLQKNPGKFLMVPVHELSNNAEKRGRVVFLVGGKFHIVELTLS
jgi:hypothetical protein